jgi:hypothetical protein
MPSGTNLMALVPWVLVVPVIVLVGLSLLRERPQEHGDTDIVFVPVSA